MNVSCVSTVFKTDEMYINHFQISEVTADHRYPSNKKKTVMIGGYYQIFIVFSLQR